MPDIRIVSHNVLWFQGEPFSGTDPGEALPDVRATLTALYASLQPDLLGLQEIQGEAAIGVMAKRLGMQSSYCPGGEMPVYGGAILWCHGALQGDARAADPRPQRMWQIVELTPDDDVQLAICNIHLPSDKHLAPDVATGKRVEELSTMLSAGPSPDLIMGDLNEEVGGEVCAFLSDEGYREVASLSRATDETTTLGGRRVDQFWLHAELTQCISGYGVVPRKRLVTSSGGKQFLSDHLPIWLSLAI